MDRNYKEILNDIKAFVFDVDGVFTDGMVIAMENGEQIRTMNTKDGYALQYAMKQGYPVGIISGGKSEGVRKRFAYLGVKDVYLGISDKSAALADFCFKYNLKHEDLLYMGDDIPDMVVLKQCGLATCPSNAVQEIKAVCQYISPYKGGEGCVRDVLTQVMKVQDKWLSDKKDATCSI